MFNTFPGEEGSDEGDSGPEEVLSTGTLGSVPGRSRRFKTIIPTEFEDLEKQHTNTLPSTRKKTKWAITIFQGQLEQLLLLSVYNFIKETIKSHLTANFS